MKKITQLFICFKIIFHIASDCHSQNSMVGDGFGGRLWYKPYNLNVGSYSAYSICPDSSQLYAWGHNGWGQLGNGNNVSSGLPIKINGIKDIKYCTAGYTAAVIKNDHSGWVFGNGFTNTPTKVIDNVKFAHCTTIGCTFVKEDGTVWSVGNNLGIGTFGNGDTSNKSFTIPQKMYGINTAVRVSNSSSTTIVLLSDGTVMTTGLHWRGRNINDTFQIPRKVPNIKDIVEIQSNAYRNLLLDKNGNVYQLDVGDSFYIRIDTLKNIVAISGCNDGISFMALDKDHNCYTWGDNPGGELGNGSTNNTPVPKLVEKEVNDILMGELFSYLIKSDGTLWASGSSLYDAPIWLNLEDKQRFNYTQINTYCQLKRMPVFIAKELQLCEGSAISFNGKYYSKQGIYKDTLKSINGDSIFQITITEKRKTTHSQNLTLCSNDSLTIGRHTYKKTGTYQDTLVNSLGCDSIITTVLNVLPISLKTIYHQIKKGDTLFYLNHRYTKAGIYLDTLKNSLGCDSILTNILEVDSIIDGDNNFGIYIPNAFSPNQDNINQQFHVVGKGIKEVKMEIFNRWGEKLFESKDINPMWDGTYKNETCKQDVFIYLITIIGIDNQVHHYAGTITLL